MKVISAVIPCYNSESYMEKAINTLLSGGEDMEISHDEKSAEIVAKMLKDGTAETIHTSEPTLETVFMTITGKELAK